MKDFRLLVTGSRSVTAPQATVVVRRLDSIYNWGSGRYRFIVIQGKCPTGGVDLVAEKWAENTPGAIGEGHPADWDRYGKAAGPKRNAHMVSLGANLVIAFPNRGSRGTWDCLQKAVDAGIEPRLYPLHLHVTATAAYPQGGTP